MSIIDFFEHKPDNVIDFIKASEVIKEKRLGQKHEIPGNETPEQVEDFVKKYRERHKKE